MTPQDSRDSVSTTNKIKSYEPKIRRGPTITFLLGQAKIFSTVRILFGRGASSDNNSQDIGSLGFYGFGLRRNRSMMKFPTTRIRTTKRIWLQSIVGTPGNETPAFEMGML
jgi:hypothetical protein